MQTIIYVMRHIDIGGHIDIPYKKVGITGAGKKCHFELTPSTNK